MVRVVKPEDINAIKEIYNYYILNSVISFEESPISLEEMSRRIHAVHPQLPWLVYEENQQILGYAYASKWNSRSGYKYSAESSVYLKHGESKKGIGTQLYSELISRLTRMGFHVIIGGIALPNDASKALHEKFGFEKVAHYKEVGFKFDKWIDVGYWELMI